MVPKGQGFSELALLIHKWEQRTNVASCMGGGRIRPLICQLLEEEEDDDDKGAFMFPAESCFRLSSPSSGVELLISFESAILLLFPRKRSCYCVPRKRSEPPSQNALYFSRH